MQKGKKELALKQSLFRFIVDYASDAIIPVDMFGKIIFWNKAAERIFGYAANEIIGEPVTRIMPTRTEIHMEDLLTTPEAPLGKSIETVGIRKNGREFPLEFSYSTWNTKQGIFLTVIARDITERKQMEQKLREYSQQLELLVEKRTKQLRETQEQLLKSERLAAIGELAGMVGHDLRNPLMGIAGAVYHLKTKAETKLDENEKRMLQIIEENIAYSNKIISDLQDYSREIILELKEVNIKKLLKESLSSVKMPENIQIIDKTRKSHKITADMAKMRRVFFNIIKNAIDAMPKGGKLAIESRKNQNFVEITFKDTGVGIPADVLEKIGKPLFTTKAKGMGFGLAICNRIIDAHNGKISIKSTIGKGTTVKLTLPTEQNREKVKMLADEPKSAVSKIKTDTANNHYFP